MRPFLLLSAINGFLAVALGAFGAHGLKRFLAGVPDGEQRMQWWQTAAHYHLTHALALGLVAWVATRTSGGWLQTTGYAFQVGILLFCGSLYVMTLSGVRALGAITPLGGLAMLTGWLGLAVLAYRLNA